MTTKKSDSHAEPPSGPKPARGRPRGFDKAAAVDKAMALFWAHGYDGVGVAELGKELGINAPSLYAAFGSKRGLFEQVIERYSACNNLLHDPRVMGAEDAAAVVEAILRVAVDFYTADPQTGGCLVIEGCRQSRDADARAITAARQTEGRRELRDRFAVGGAADPDGLADYMGVVLSGLSGAARDGMDRERLHRIARAVAAGAAGYIG